MQYAGCCKPLPDEPIAGFITTGRGISIHRQDCVKFQALAADMPERIIDVGWQDDGQQRYLVTLRIVAADRTGLLRDIITTLSNDRINIDDIRSSTDHARRLANMHIIVEVPSMKALGRVIERIARVPGVEDVSRATE
jgi:GTP pyrophosphokinase